jgi:ferredoxin
MPKLTVEGVGQYEVPLGKRLVLALEHDAAIDQLHACGGQARCTTCRVEFLDGEPDRMTVAERDLLAARGLTESTRRTRFGVRTPRSRPRWAATLRGHSGTATWRRPSSTP